MRRLTNGWLLLGALALATPLLAVDPYAPAGTGGLELVDHALLSLQQHRRLLIVGAHPDDEDTVLLTLVSRGQGGEAAYLSLTRGEGGQNLVGDELGEALGVLRTEELLAAREIDGARQFFTRAYDFGYTRSLEETLSFWPREELLEDTVRVIRRFRPQVVVSVFPPGRRAGHGQHQAAGVMAEAAFRAAGEQGRFPELTAEGLLPWRPRFLYREAWWDPEAATLSLEAGHLDPFTGRTWAQLAMEGRSRHRSQSMGRLQDPGPRPVLLTRLAAPEGADPDRLFGGFPTELEVLADLLPPGDLRTSCRDRLQGISARARETRASLRPVTLSGAAGPLAEILTDLRDLLETLRNAETTTPGTSHLLVLLEEKERLTARALSAAAGLVFDAWAESSTAVAGDQLEVTVSLWNGGPFRLRLTTSPSTLASRRGWLDSPRAFPLHAPDEDGEAPDSGESLETLDPGDRGTATPSIRIAEDAPVTAPYFLREPREGPFYDFGTVDLSLRGLPFGPEPLEATVRFALEIDGRIVPLTLRRPVVARSRDLARGETRRPVRLVPRIEVEVAPELLVWPENLGDRRSVEVRLRLHGEEARSGRLDLDPPPEWTTGESPRFRLSSQRPELGTSLALERPEDVDRGRRVAEIGAVTEGDERYALAVPLVRHPHVRPRPVPRPSRVEISNFDLELPPLQRVGYVRGAADRVPEVLSAVGVPLEEIRPGRLTEIDLGDYDALIVGSRAYESAPGLHEATPRLNRYVREGGLLVVQFQRWEYFREGRPPVPVEMEGRGRRTTDETAPVEILQPGHRAFSWPNRIGTHDWEGWVQERGLYYPTSWGGEVTSLLSLSEPGDPDQRGSLLVAEVGEGTWVYTGLAFFRQLPAGVPGGFRLFANLLGLEAPR